MAFPKAVANQPRQECLSDAVAYWSRLARRALDRPDDVEAGAERNITDDEGIRHPLPHDDEAANPDDRLSPVGRWLKPYQPRSLTRASGPSRGTSRLTPIACGATWKGSSVTN